MCLCAEHWADYSPDLCNDVKQIISTLKTFLNEKSPEFVTQEIAIEVKYIILKYAI